MGRPARTDTRFRLLPVLAAATLALLLTGCGERRGGSGDPLPSWEPGTARTRILEFVAAVTKKGGPSYVPPAERIATFDNDGTLWAEQPLYFQLQFALDQVKALAPQHPEWKTRQPFQAVLEGDRAALAAQGKEGLLELLKATHTGTTTGEFDMTVREWIREARHPRFDRPYTDVVYQPMLELMDYLRANEFQVWIASAGGIEFMRTFAQDVYGVPPSQVIGSSVAVEYELRDGKPVLARLPKVGFIDDGPGKPVAIHQFIGRRPIASFGNSDGDLQMLEWTAAGPGRRLCLLVHHTDEEREWAYGPGSPIGRLDKALGVAEERGWVVVDMKRDWECIFPFDTD